MMIGPWICDECGGEIATPQDGWVEWLRPDDGTGSQPLGKMRLVHSKMSSSRRNGCFYASKPEIERQYFILDDHMHQFTGPGGLMRLLDMCDPESSHYVHGAAELTRRLHVPGYEIARAQYADAVAEGVVDEVGGSSRLSMAAIEAILQHVKSQK